MTVRVPLPRGRFAIVDDADAPRVLEKRWHTKTISSRPGYIYAQHTYRLTPGRQGKKTSIQLHRFIVDAQPGQIVDHIDGDPLNNVRSNLRITDARGNSTNVTRSKNQRTGGFKGVSWNKGAGKYEANIAAGEVKANGKRRKLYLGLFTDPRSAARAYDAAALKFFGEFAALNFPEEPVAPAESEVA